MARFGGDESSMKRNSISVLVVDDVEQIRNQLVATIEAQPFLELAGTASSGYESISITSQVRPDVIIMDIEMESHLAGIYATKEILRLFPETKILAYSKHKEEYYIYQAFQYGITDYLLKDTSATDVVRSVQRAYSGQSMIHPTAAACLRSEFIRLRNTQENISYLLTVLLTLTPTELEILFLLSKGMKQQDIAKYKFVELSTIKTHISSILKKFERRSTNEILELICKTNFFALINMK